MTPEEFKSFASQGFNRIPITREVLADLDTPLSAYMKLADGPYSYLFESVQRCRRVKNQSTLTAIIFNKLQCAINML